MFFISQGIPQITDIKLVKEAFVDGKMHLRCIATGDGRLTYKWLFNNQDIPSSGLFEIKNEDLKNFRLRKSDEGVYKCLVSNKYGTTFNQINVTVNSEFVKLCLHLF